ncbi:MAG: SDR family NAD(P)-dependent oxidoreductase [Nevskia sp.]|nr:SDR family NAD(P)-dependent oxidoreductase [Nevskia sp.]
MATAEDKVLFITGAARGIGAATARDAIGRGHRVVLADIDADAVQALAASLGPTAHGLALDVRDPAQWQAALEQAWRHFGRVDVLINNAGVVHTGYVLDVPFEQHRHTVEVNYLGNIAGVLAALPRFIAQGGGHLITVCSLTAYMPFPSLASYAGIKHALRGFHHSLAWEYRKQPLHFTIVYPPAVETPMLQQEAQDDSAIAAFGEPPIAPEVMARAIVDAVARRPREVALPAVQGWLLRAFGAFVWIMRIVLADLERHGRKNLAARRASTTG